MPTDNYLPNETYWKLVNALAGIEPSPMDGGPNIEKIQEALGEIGGVWPASIQGLAG
ncbi:hypothetical protein ACFFTN_27540 [Aminobacter aganoensis]|uniref:Uncharacterized protein n=1 Tax=Aminobacter aganoensis TaxID=83264 RepID=A0A7X0FE30_9HYPH|nr:hypothetical protein [Aminobacter aganoensis]MBB6357649.1 hypothetical protein [Aminobacter aganoensis]